VTIRRLALIVHAFNQTDRSWISDSDLRDQLESFMSDHPEWVNVDKVTRQEILRIVGLEKSSTATSRPPSVGSTPGSSVQAFMFSVDRSISSSMTSANVATSSQRQPVSGIETPRERAFKKPSGTSVACFASFADPNQQPSFPRKDPTLWSITTTNAAKHHNHRSALFLHRDSLL
jgi:hypothetical protein